MTSFKTNIQKMLQWIGIYERLKMSRLYDLYWCIADRRWINQRNAEINFYGATLTGFRKGDLVIDVGANHGDKTDIFLRLGAKVVAVEPDEMNQGILQRKFLSLRLFPKQVSIVGKAVSDKKGTITMLIDGPGSAMNTLSEKWAETLRADKRLLAQTKYTLDFAQRKEVETTTIDDLISLYGSPRYVKIDVEGHELGVLRGMREPVPCLSFEVNLPEFRSEGLECISVLERLAADGKFNYSTSCEQGMVLERWLSPHEFSQVLNQCTERSIEVFWQTPVPVLAVRPRARNTCI